MLDSVITIAILMSIGCLIYGCYLEYKAEIVRQVIETLKKKLEEIPSDVTANSTESLTALLLRLRTQ